MNFTGNAVLLMVLIVPSALVQESKDQAATSPAQPAGLSAAAEDISGAYSFLHEGENLQINLEPGSVSGYIVRKGDLDSDRGVLLSQFFLRASVDGHNVSFTTKTIHGVWFEFNGRFERGPGKTRASDAYYLLKGELKEFTTDADDKTTSRTSHVEFKWIGQPE